MSAVWRADPLEAATVTGLLVAFRDHYGRSSPSAESFLASVQHLIGRSDTEFWLAAGDHQTPASAVCQLRFRHSVWTASEDCWLEDLYVAPPARRLGLGRALVQRTLDRARERGCHRVELDTNEDNYDAIRLYRSLGFSDTAKGASRSLFFGARVQE
jgi:ribosomal protein S18 acetylase RimI-like enzyme